MKTLMKKTLLALIVICFCAFGYTNAFTVQVFASEGNSCVALQFIKADDGEGVFKSQSKWYCAKTKDGVIQSEFSESSSLPSGVETPSASSTNTNVQTAISYSGTDNNFAITGKGSLLTQGFERNVPFTIGSTTWSNFQSDLSNALASVTCYASNARYKAASPPVIIATNDDVIDTSANPVTPNTDDYEEVLTGEETEVDDSTDHCYANAGALGWVLCPVISFAADALNTVYGEIEKNFLNISPQFLATSGNTNGAYQAWEIFRNLANIAFVILLLVVIFSQLTGVGISNYGIKKALPRLIIVAILINLSFIICQLAVDISNIIGASLKDFLSGIAEGLNQNIDTTQPAFGSYFVSLGAGVLIGAIFWQAMGPALLLSFGLVLISGLISVLFLFVILVAREVGVILAVALAPLAFVCYLLPNTEKVAKKWLSLFGKLLLLYPLCALVVGGGQLASVIIANGAGTNGWLLLAAMLLQVLPFLAIPSLMKSSLAGFGKLGDTISGLGQKANANTVGKFRSSDAYKHTRTNLKNVDPGNLRTRIAQKAGGIPLVGAATRNARARQSDAAKQQAVQDRNAQATLYETQFGNETWNKDNNFMSEWKDAFTRGDTKKLQALTQYGTQRYQKAFVDAAANYVSENAKGNNKNHRASARALSQYMQTDSNFANLAKKNADFNEYVIHDGINDAKEYTSGSEVNSTLKTAEDVANLSDEAIKRFSEENQGNEPTAFALAREQFYKDPEFGKNWSAKKREILGIRNNSSNTANVNNQPPVPSGYEERDSGLIVPHPHQ